MPKNYTKIQYVQPCLVEIGCVSKLTGEGGRNYNDGWGFTKYGGGFIVPN